MDIDNGAPTTTFCYQFRFKINSLFGFVSLQRVYFVYTVKDGPLCINTWSVPRIIISPNRSFNAKSAQLNMNKLALVVALLGVVGVCQAVIRQGQCPTVPVQEDFNLNRYLGRWYEIQRYEAEFQVNLDCTTAQYSLADPNVARVTVVNSGILFNETSASPFEVRGVAIPTFPDDPRNPGKFNVAFFGAEPDRSNYWVVGTDYTGYSVVWSCEQISATSYQEFAWVLSREKELTPAQYAQVYTLITDNNIPIADFRFTDQSVRCYLDM